MENNKDFVNKEKKALVENEKIEALIPDGVEEKNNKFSFLIIFLILFIAIVVGLIVYGFIFYNNSKELTVYDDEQDIVEIKEELKRDISNKIYQILGGVTLDNYNENNTYESSNFNLDLLNGVLLDETKQNIVLSYLETDKDESNRWIEQEEIASLRKKDKNMYLEYLGSINLDEYNKHYEELFGNVSNDILKTNGYCPTYYYSDTYKEFYKILSACGFESNGTYISYISKFETTEDALNVYVSFGSIVSNNEKYNVYGDFELDENNNLKYINLIEEIELNSNDTYKITKDNYDIFSSYKFTFVEYGENYYFDNIKKIN